MRRSASFLRRDSFIARTPWIARRDKSTVFTPGFANHIRSPWTQQESFKLVQVNAFTLGKGDRERFSGNPAAVCILPQVSKVSDDWMQGLAGEMNLSETAFVQPLDELEDKWSLRWFTPTSEVDLCGHATLATSHALWEQELVGAKDTIQYSTKSGEHSAQKRGSDFVELSFPAEPSTAVSDAEYEELLPQITEGFGIDATKVLHIGKNRMDILIEIEGGNELLTKMKPNYSILAELPARVLIVTCLPSEKVKESHPNVRIIRASETGCFASDQRYALSPQQVDFVSRCFAPAVGVNEDPVCGSAHCCMSPYWAAKLPPKKKNGGELTALSLAARGGLIKMKNVEDKVLLAGRATTSMVGCVRAPVAARQAVK
jgi:PhzF family phenazine biosynthesis protein